MAYDSDSKWFWTLNRGVTWSSADVKTKTESGWGFTFGRSFNYNYSKFFSYDLRLRFLKGDWFGQDYKTTDLTKVSGVLASGETNYKANYNLTVLNHYTKVGETSLELLIHANKLRERTAWDVFVFGGIGIAGYKVRGDLLDQNNFNGLYQYDSYINFEKNTLKNKLDQNYESYLDGNENGKTKYAVMPSLGIGVGYQVGSRFSIGLEHKTTFTQLDNFDGFEANGNKDLFHYTGGYLRFHFKKRKSETSNEYNPDIPNLPQVKITQPSIERLGVGYSAYVVQATVKYVPGKDSITFLHNGRARTDFSYIPSKQRIEMALVLDSGMNKFQISAVNPYGKAVDSVSLIYDKSLLNPPTIQVLNPTTLSLRTDKRTATLVAKLTHIDSKDQIEIKQNGELIEDFTYDFDKNLTVNLNLYSGMNNIVISCRNQDGTAAKTVSYTYVRPQTVTKPYVQFINPAVNPATVGLATFSLKAKIEGVATSQDISLKVNGANQVFKYNQLTELLEWTGGLILGANTFEVGAKNQFGTETKSTVVVFKKKEEPCLAPEIQFNQPYSVEETVTQRTFSIAATTRNVANKDQLSLLLNGSSTSFNFINGQLSATVQLIEGINLIQLKANTSCGTKVTELKITRKVCVTPQLTINSSSVPENSITTNAQISVSVRVNERVELNAIKVKLNGKGVSPQLNRDRINFSFTSNLNLGKNEIEIEVTNSCGLSSEKVFFITRNNISSAGSIEGGGKTIDQKFSEEDPAIPSGVKPQTRPNNTKPIPPKK